jgi:cob(I)alamin adenosyltransferase
MATYFTRKGDDGFSGLLREGRTLKSDLVFETLGTIDEASAALGVARSVSRSVEAAQVVQIQRDLYGMMGEVASSPDHSSKFRVIDAVRVEWLELRTTQAANQVEVPREFIVPGDSPAGAAFDLARAVVRRAERRLVELFQRGDIQNPEILRYINRLSSLCFVFELLENKAAGVYKITLAAGQPE